MRNHPADDPEVGFARNRVIDLICQASHLPPASVEGQASLRELGFDSLRHFQLMLEIEGIIGWEFGDGEADAILCCATVDDLCDTLSAIVEGQTQSGSVQQPPTDGPAPT